MGNLPPRELSFQLWEAVLASASKLGLENVLPRIVAQQLALNVGTPALFRREGRQGEIDATLVHGCGPHCRGSPRSCLTALQVEALVNRGAEFPFTVRKVSLRRDGTCRVLLSPLVPEPPSSGRSL